MEKNIKLCLCILLFVYLGYLLSFGLYTLLFGVSGTGIMPAFIITFGFVIIHVTLSVVIMLYLEFKDFRFRAYTVLTLCIFPVVVLIGVVSVISNVIGASFAAAFVSIPLFAQILIAVVLILFLLIVAVSFLIYYYSEVYLEECSKTIDKTNDKTNENYSKMDQATRSNDIKYGREYRDINQGYSQFMNTTNESYGFGEKELVYNNNN